MSESHPIPPSRHVKDLTGQRFVRLVVVRYAGGDRRGRSLWLCRCDCGTECVTDAAEMKRGHKQSCGCLRREMRGKTYLTHGMSNTPTYDSWQAMLRRCTDPTAVQYPQYGGRGITVCDRWLNSFEEFLADLGVRPKGTTIDRKDVNGNYEPGNCRWATNKEQMRNRRNSRIIEYDGKRLTLSAWAEITGLRHSNILQRLASGWSVEKALTFPADRSATMRAVRAGKI